MAFEFKLSTDEIREKMFDFMKPVYKGTMDTEVDHINWTYGVHDSNSGFFITYVSLKKDNSKYILINENSGVFYITAHRYRHTLSEIPYGLKKYEEIIQDAIKLYNNEKIKKRFLRSLSNEQKSCLDEITENMKDKCRPAIDINSYEDAEKLFYKEKFNYYYISRMYNKNTVTNYDKYMSDDKMRIIRGEKYRNIISKISAYGNTLSEDDCRQLSQDFREAGYLITRGIDDIYVEITLDIIRKVYPYRVNISGYVYFIEEYIKNWIKVFPDKIQHLSSILDFINEYMRSEDFEGLEFYKKELEKRIYNKVEGFQFVLTTDKIREKMFDFLKPVYGQNLANIDWLTGVYDEKRGIFLTLICYVSDGIARCGMDFYNYIVITDSGNIFRVDNDYEFAKKAYNFKIPDQYQILAERVKEGIEFYGYNYKYKSILNEETEKELRVIKNIMDDRCRKNFSVNCEADARRLFELVNYNMDTIFRTYNKKTINDFNEFATDDKLMLWRGDKYLQLLKEISRGNITNQECCRNFNTACYLFCSGVNDAYDKQFLNAVEYMHNARSWGHANEDRLNSYIKVYMEEYTDKLKNIAPLIKFIDPYIGDRCLKQSVEDIKKSLIRFKSNKRQLINWKIHVDM